MRLHLLKLALCIAHFVSMWFVNVATERKWLLLARFQVVTYDGSVPMSVAASIAIAPVVHLILVVRNAVRTWGLGRINRRKLHRLLHLVLRSIDRNGVTVLDNVLADGMQRFVRANLHDEVLLQWPPKVRLDGFDWLVRSVVLEHDACKEALLEARNDRDRGRVEDVLVVFVAQG